MMLGYEHALICMSFSVLHGTVALQRDMSMRVLTQFACTLVESCNAMTNVTNRYQTDRFVL